MSRMSDELEQVLTEDDSIQGIFQLITGQGSVPCFRKFTQMRDKSMNNILRAASLHYAGADPWPDGKAAIDATAGKFQGDFMLHEMKAFSLGLLVGACPVNPEGMMDEGMLFELRWVTKATQLSEDKEVNDILAKDLAKHVAGVSHVLGFIGRTGKETQHVWDVWHAALGASSTALYVAGVKLGQRRYEEEALAGIERVTNE